MTQKKKEQSEYDSTATCVACGGVIYIKNKLRCKHTCAKTHDAAQQAADRAAHDTVPTRRELSLNQRLSLGFELLAEDDN